MTKEILHIGDYVNKHLNLKGVSKAFISKRLKTTPQAFQKKLNREEWKLSEIEEFEEAIEDDNFFDEYFKNSYKKRVINPGQSFDSGVNESVIKYGGNSKPGYRIYIEPDPDNFDPEEWQELGLAIKEVFTKVNKPRK